MAPSEADSGIHCLFSSLPTALCQDWSVQSTEQGRNDGRSLLKFGYKRLCMAQEREANP